MGWLVKSPLGYVVWPPMMGGSHVAGLTERAGFGSVVPVNRNPLPGSSPQYLRGCGVLDAWDLVWSVDCALSGRAHVAHSSMFSSVRVFIQSCADIRKLQVPSDEVVLVARIGLQWLGFGVGDVSIQFSPSWVTCHDPIGLRGMSGVSTAALFGVSSRG